MLVEVNRVIRSKDWIIFLWMEPASDEHPARDDLSLGRRQYIRAQLRRGHALDYLTRSPNAGHAVTNLKFTPGIENQVMQSITTDKKEPMPRRKNGLSVIRVCSHNGSWAR
jgi:glycine betaine/proline transport system substrate-binding protein